MAAFALTDTEIFAGPLGASCFGNTVELTRSVDVAEVTTFCSGGWREYVPALTSWNVTFGGPQDLAATAASTTQTPDEVYLLTLGSAFPLTLAPSGAAEGSVAYGSNGLFQAYTPLKGAVGAAAEHSVAFSPSIGTPLVRGYLMSRATVTATGNGTGRQVGAVSSTQSMYAGVHFLTAGGTTPSITVVLESDDNSNFTSATTRITFTAATTRTAEWKQVAGVITDDYWRFRWTVSGTNPSFQVRCFAGIL